MQTGQTFPGRCKAINQCDYCAKLAAVENTELLTLDALLGVAPALYALLTTRTATLDLSGFYAARRKVQKALKRRWPAAEFAYLLEFTTGRGVRSGGLRRPHWNVLVKGIPVGDRLAALEIIRRVWCDHVDALPAHQDLQEIRSVGGLMRYIAMHFQKQSQAPPDGFKGHRFTASRGYLWLPTAEAREAARASLARKRMRHRVEQQCPDLDPAEVDDVVDQALVLAGAQDWKLVQSLPVSSRNPRPERAYAPPAQAAAILAAREAVKGT
uniref:Uncharacterized protein n=1 Tax=uncultured prokaryote TaxID=198431 RepID=A0A0H5Q313_9ZZZZ|nr:hypothetical protein [uncultured prokaryote]